MKKIKLSKKLKKESVDYLQNYLKKKRRKSLSLTKKIAIKKLIEKEQKEIRELAGKIIDNDLCKLSITLLLNQSLYQKLFDRYIKSRDHNWKGFKEWLVERKETPIMKINGRKEVNLNAVLVLHAMKLIIDTADHHGQLDLLNEYRRKKYNGNRKI